jgi:hypothetical protein
MAGVTGRDLPVFPRTNPDELLTHCVVLVTDQEGDYLGDYLIDWTARQYDPTADHPALIRPWPKAEVVDEDEDPDDVSDRLLAEIRTELEETAGGRL